MINFDPLKSILILLRKILHIAFACILIFTTTASIWSHLIEDQDDPIELRTETDSEKGEKEGKKGLEEWDDDFASEVADITPSINGGFQKTGSSSFCPTEGASSKLYILYSRLKLDC
ncbi:hypothetical protein [Ekhidna sp.]|uniref:hypothetical protein n=1 Tax=Ekhidna sp. TaxID=2608089 RepID=UPI003B5C12E5